VGRLDDEDIDALFNAVVNAGLDASRDALFAGVPPLYYRKFPSGGNPIGQVRVDLGRLNNDAPLANGRVPFRSWLRNALSMSEGTAEGEVFRSALIKLERKLAEPLGPVAAEVTGTLASWKESELRGLVKYRLATRGAQLGEDAKDPLRVVSEAAQGGWLDQLILATLTQHIDDTTLVRLAEARGLLPRISGVEADRLEKIVRQKTPFLDVEAWRTKLALREAAVARVEIQRSGMWKPAGTGFLVGADLLMTNHHVVQELLGHESVKGELRFRFDFKRTAEADTPQAGLFVEPVANERWLELSATPSAVDKLPDPGGQEPAEGELDFALIRLAVPVGLRPIGTLDEKAPGRVRGWMRLEKDTALTLLGEGQSVFILQHPGGDALQISFGDFLRVGARRVRYDANTLPGSSGSPCLDVRLDLVALHHAGDESHAEFNKAGYNQGIPIHLIVARCEAAGVVFEAPPA
jgi:hypothetical protein